MVQVPIEKGGAVVLEPGQLLNIRVFCGVSLYEFSGRLRTLLLNPRNYMLLDFPEKIKQKRFRSHERAPCAIPVHIESPLSRAHSSADGFHFQDLSGSGAALIGPFQLGEEGQIIRLRFDFYLAATDTHEQVMLDAAIQSVQKLNHQCNSATACHHGIRFLEIEPRILLLVSELLRPLH